MFFHQETRNILVASVSVTITIVDAQCLDALILWALQNGDSLLCDFSLVSWNTNVTKARLIVYYLVIQQYSSYTNDRINAW